MKILSAHVTPGPARAGQHRMAVCVVAQRADGRSAIAYTIDPISGDVLMTRPVDDMAAVSMSLLEFQLGGFPPVVDSPPPPPPRQPVGSERIVDVAKKLWSTYQEAIR